MSRNHFESVPQINMKRSVFDKSHGHKTTIQPGQLIPIMVDEVLPGETKRLSTSSVIRVNPTITPVMDNLYLDIYYFFVPNRLVWDHHAEFHGENRLQKWKQTKGTHYQIPQITSPYGTGWYTNSLADYFGLPVGATNMSVSHLPFRGYVKIWNEWFRNQNLQDPVLEVTSSGTTQGSNSSAVSEAEKGGVVLKVNRYKDFLTTAMTDPQKAQDVLLPLFGGNPLPVYSMPNSVPQKAGEAQLKMHALSGSLPPGGSSGQEWDSMVVSAAGQVASASGAGAVTSGVRNSLVPNNLWADASNVGTASINELRMAFQMQKMFERDARSGTRYTEMLLAHFGVTSSDARLDRPEYLGGFHTPLNQTQVPQTSATQTGATAEKINTPQAHLAAFTHHSSSDDSFTKSFEEHGYVFGLAVVRVENSYQNKIDKMWSRKDRTDFYMPVFANIGEQPILRKEVNYTGTNGHQDNEKVFGYQEAWYGYRNKTTQVTGNFRSTPTTGYGTLDMYHYGQNFGGNSFPIQESFVTHEHTALDRNLAISSSTTTPIQADFWFDYKVTLPMPQYSVPGLIDHN